MNILAFFQKYNLHIQIFVSCIWVAIIASNYNDGIELLNRRNIIPALFLLFNIFQIAGEIKRRNAIKNP